VIHPWWADGKKELIAVIDGVRESELSWKEVLLNLKSRGLEHAPELAIGDGSLGFWTALRQVFPTTREQRCTVHKTMNVLSKLPKSLQPQAKRLLHDIWQAPSRAEADKAFDLFLNTFEAKFLQVAECLAKDRDEPLTLYDFPAENWCHIRTTNPIESTFATIRIRQRKTRGCGSAKARFIAAASRLLPPSSVGGVPCLFKLAQCASKGWRKLRGHTHLKDLLQGVRFIDGENKHTLKEKKLQRSSEINSSKETAA
jgi:putative transposase